MESVLVLTEAEQIRSLASEWSIPFNHGLLLTACFIVSYERC